MQPITERTETPSGRTIQFITTADRLTLGPSQPGNQRECGWDMAAIDYIGSWLVRTTTLNTVALNIDGLVIPYHFGWGFDNKSLSPDFPQPTTLRTM